MPKSLVKSVDYESEATKARLPYAIKRYFTEGKNIPLKKNWSENHTTLAITYGSILDDVLNFEVRNDDVFLVTFMKSGTTWMQECAWLLLNNLDFHQAKMTSVIIRSPCLDMRGIMPDYPDPIHELNHYTTRRLIKTHLQPNLMPLEVWEKKPKIIYVARNVKDVIVSSFHFVKGFDLWHGNNISEFVEDFLNNEIIYTDYWTHVLNFWQMRHEPFVFFVTYEEMQCDMAGVLQRLCTFLERPQLNKEELDNVLDYVSFDSRKESTNTSVHNLFTGQLPIVENFKFLRRGIVGSFKDELTPELIAKIDKWTCDNLKPYGIKEEDICGIF